MPARRFFQIHLSTAVVLMLVAGSLGWANIQGRVWKGGSEARSYIATSIGWPLEYRYDLRYYPYSTDYPDKPAYHREFSLLGVVVNVLLVPAILLGTYFVCEWLIRRRAVPSQKSP